MEISGKRQLPENAYRKLKPGEKYEPIIKHNEKVFEITTRSVGLGLIMTAIFSAAAAYLGLKIAQVFEAAIPIAILAVGYSGIVAAMGLRKSTLLENVIVQSIGSASGVIVAGSIFTLPALFILGLPVDFFKIFLVGVLGGFIGILFMILFRKYFVAEMHGEFPFPEGTATTEVLVAGEEGGKQAKILAIAMLIGGIYDFLILTISTWAEVWTTRFIEFGAKIADEVKMVFKLNVVAAVIGLGYIVGLRYALIICAGSFLSWFIFIPLVSHFGQYLSTAIPPVTDGTLISAMSAEDIFVHYVRLIGIGGICAAGIIGIIKSSKIIWESLTKGLKEMFSSKLEATDEANVRTNLDIKMSYIFVIIAALVIAVFIFFRFSILVDMPGATRLSIIALLVVFVISFLFTTVAARAIAIVGINPVSGMTLMTLILSSVILLKAGLSGASGMLAALLIGGVVCTALSMSGAFISDLKIGYWIGSTPRSQQRWKFLGTIVAAICVGGVILLLNETYGFVVTPEHPTPLPAPQANAMAAVIKTLMSAEAVPWLLYGIGVIVAILLEMMKIPALPFALGMYIPQSLNTPILLGAFLAYLVAKSSRNEEVAKARKDRGILIASGFVAGGAIMGVVDAILKYVGVKDKIYTGFGETNAGQWVALIAVIALSLFTYYYAKAAKKEK